MITESELDTRFSYHAPDEWQVERYQEIREEAREFADLLVRYCPNSRELSLAMTHLDSVVMFANAAIARREAKRSEQSTPNPE